jgi:hypothetical protein
VEGVEAKAAGGAGDRLDRDAKGGCLFTEAAGWRRQAHIYLVRAGFKQHEQ